MNKEKIVQQHTLTDQNGNVQLTSITYDTGYRTPNGIPIMGWAWCSAPGIQIARKEHVSSNNTDSHAES